MSGASGLRLKEATTINLSLSTLGRVIRGIVRGDDSIPFRESKLTHLLQVRSECSDCSRTMVSS